jgi:acrylyl-CoA reductase (NADPH)
MSITFKALLAHIKSEKFAIEITNRERDELPEGNTLLKVQYSSLNFKDSMALNGNMGKILRNLPMSPGIDLAGIVESTTGDQFKVGDEVIGTGWGLGETHSGGYSQIAQMHDGWLVKKPTNISVKHSMSVGTAGLTAMLSVTALENEGITNSQGNILVTGASGGVGSISIILLSKLGYSVTAVTGRTESKNYLKELGASDVLPRDELLAMTRPLNSSKWAGAIDTVGGTILANLLSAINYDGAVACCGNTAGNDLPTTVLPFILRKVKLIGIDSVFCPIEPRTVAWQRLGELISPKEFELLTQEISLNDVLESAKNMLEGKVRGRTVINLKDL